MDYMIIEWIPYNQFDNIEELAKNEYIRNPNKIVALKFYNDQNIVNKFFNEQFTEEELEEASKRSRTSVNWTEYNKWVKDGKPYEEEDFIDQKCKNDSQQRSVGAKRGNLIRKGRSGHGVKSNDSSGKTTRKAWKKSIVFASTNTKSKTTTCKDGEYSNKTLGSNKISHSIKLHEHDDSKSAKR
ncbi:hypothetical protein GLOIN_2v1784882 [Rhizophagus irregularis DAOM 181602=DAOM 197198]|uniref:Uncharacterized protein n=1 Tax=Rhizophagus irregularis (strain DAOM 181602 / DAOM 197198 / MUCL 43194) TaxID=747089 RepID=A0A2P4PBK1_RHIID|nr:hypothetical protein GLOIN_2v1784882 [Rhizophagus irregularis DAOM 181602=DAOM 197198]POG62762.1 hypothetical protein GLOIN_2v1784882 [Rhizophagus irregularis DAOM 181602=DAOM 197198]|eukprot:XP_025169628.1 hypothetical protein GLOIN_2v1784882 [Rhizophagus irregularis DAOM 181602=DAOM 197198]